MSQQQRDDTVVDGTVVADEAWGTLTSLNPRYPSVPLQGTEVLIGRSATCTLTFANPRVSKRHCRIYRAVRASEEEPVDADGDVPMTTTTTTSVGSPPSSPTNSQPLSPAGSPKPFIPVFGAGVGTGDPTIDELPPPPPLTPFEVRLEDLSKMGTFVDGVLVGKGKVVRLSAGTVITLFTPSIELAQAKADTKDNYVAYRFTPTHNAETATTSTATATTVATANLSQESNRSPRSPSFPRATTDPLQRLARASSSVVRLSGKSQSLQAACERTWVCATSSGDATASGGRPRSARRRPRFFDIDLKRLLACPEAVEAETPANAKYRKVTIVKPHVFQTTYAAQVFKAVELAFRRFINKDRTYNVDRVHVIVNEQLEKKFRKTESTYRARTPVNNTRVWDGLEAVTMEYLQECVFQVDDDDVLNGDVTPILGWHGSTAENINKICDDGFKILSTSDGGWYGKGAYFTQLPNYGEVYVNDLKRKVGNFSLLLSWVLLGRPCPITKLCEGEPCTPGFDSHYVLVNDYLPLKSEDVQPTGDEAVVFNTDAILPRFVVDYSYKPREEIDQAGMLTSEADDVALPIVGSKRKRSSDDEESDSEGEGGGPTKKAKGNDGSWLRCSIM